MPKTDHRQKSRVEGAVPGAVMAPGRPILGEVEVPAVVLENWQATLDLLSKIANVPAALIMRVHPEEIEVLVASHGPGNVYHAGERSPLHLGLYCEMVMSTRHELNVPNALKDPKWDRNPDIALGMISYCGLPLTWPNGEIFGTICILDREEHEHGLAARQVLERFADSITLSLASIYESSASVTQATAERDFLVESSDDLICVLGVDGNVKSLNPAWEKVLGYSQRELLSRPIFDFIHPEDRQVAVAEATKLAKGQQSLQFENRYVARDGSIRNVLWTATASHGEGLIYCIGKDITERKQAEAAVRASEERLRNLFDNLDAGIVVHAPDTSIVQSNHKAGVLLGLTADQLGGKVAGDPGWRFVREDGSPLPLPEYPVNQVVASGRPVVGQVVGVDRPAGAGRIWVLANAYPEFDPAGALRQVVVTFVDITGRKEAEQALRLQQSRLDAAAISGKLGLWDLDLATGRAWRTPQHDRLFGYEELQSSWGPEDALRHVVPEDHLTFHRAFETAFATGRFHYELRINPVGRPVRWIEATGEVVRDEAGHPVRLRGSVADITDRKQVEAAVADREKELRTFLDAIPIPAFRKDAESRWLLGNRALFETVGKSAEACLGRSDLEIFGDPAVGEAVMRNDRRILASGVAEVVEEEIQTPAGPRTFHSTKVPYRDSEGRVIGIVGAALDITDRRRAEEGLRAASAYARSLIEASLDPLVTIDPDGKITDVNRATEEATGVPRARLVGTDFADYFTEPEKARSGYQQVLGQGEVRDYALTLRHESGRTIDVLYNATVYADASGNAKGVFAAARDVTDRRRGEEALRKSEARYRGLFESMMDGFVVVGMDGDIRSFNEEYRKMLGYSAEELATLTYKDVTPERWHPVEARIVAEQILPRGFSDVYEKEYRRKDGTVFPVELRTFLLREDGRPDAMWAIVRDVTAVRSLQAQLALASRLAAMGTLVAGVAHEVNNPLAAVLADRGVASEVVQEVRDRLRRSEPIDRQNEAKRLDDVIEALDDAEEGGRRIAQIVKDLAKFARPAEERGRVRLIDAVQQALRWLPATVGRMATVSVEDGGAPDVLASFGQIEQVVVNLVTNAAKASKPGELGVVIVRTSPGSPGMSRLEVIDRGVGIDPAIRDRVFDPFFTTRQAGEGKGMGLGLSICHGIVTKHGGTLTVQSEAGKGSTFRVELPAAPADT